MTMEQPSPQSEDHHVLNPEVAHEAANFANDVLDSTAEERGGKPLSPEAREEEVTYASNMAEAQAKNHAKAANAQVTEITAARKAVDRATAKKLAPELVEERDTAVEGRRVAERAAMVDRLTDLANQAAFIEAAPAAEQDPNTFFIVLDGDNFGTINKDHDQGAGDAAIIVLAEAARRAAADFGNNRVFRNGGDEFYILAEADIADLIITNANKYLRARIASGEPLIDAQGETYPADWYDHLGISGAWAKTKSEAERKMHTIKKQAKEDKRAKAATFDHDTEPLAA